MINPELTKRSSRVRGLVLAALLAALTAVGAFLSFPLLGVVPFSLQVVFVLLAGLLLGPSLGASSMVAYLTLGLVAPVYAGGATGLGSLVGPSGGYLWGFVVGAALVGWVARRRQPRSVVGLTATALVGLVPIYTLGTAWLSLSLGFTDARAALWAGVLQFVPGDVLKAVCAALVARALLSAPVTMPVRRLPDSTPGAPVAPP